MTCPTCKGSQRMFYDLGTPPWPNKPGEAPNQVIDVECPDCGPPCDQCAHPNHDGIHKCRKFDPGGTWLEPAPPRALEP